MKPDVKKLVILNLPYLIFVYLFGKCWPPVPTCRESSCILRAVLRRLLQIPSPACTCLISASVSPVL